MDLIEYFERQRKRCERELKYAEAAGFQLCEQTAQGEQDITPYLRRRTEQRPHVLPIIVDARVINPAADRLQ